MRSVIVIINKRIYDESHCVSLQQLIFKHYLLLWVSIQGDGGTCLPQNLECRP